MATTTTTNIPTLKINYLTKAQYDTALANNEINENELYFTEIPNNAEYLFLTGGNVTGPTSFGDSVNIDELTVGDIVVNGKLTIGGTVEGLFSGGPISTLNITGNFNATIHCFKRNGIVTLSGNSTTAQLVKNSWNTIATLPEAYRPCGSNSITFIGIDNATTNVSTSLLEMRISPVTGDITVYGWNDSGVNNQIYFTVTYIGPVNTSEDSDIFIEIPDYETSGSEDEALYNAITALNWQSEVIE